jgi:DNA-directed RNA polymerase specialized sigma24 family protein
MDARRSWLTILELQSLGDFETTPALDLDISARARAAQSDDREREVLFGLLATKVARFSHRLRRWTGASWDYDDILQETYIAFNDVLQSWHPLDEHGPPSGFIYYFLSVYPLRLSDRIASLASPCSSRRLALLQRAEVEASSAAEDVELTATTQALLEQICGRLNASDAAILCHRAAGRQFVPAQLRQSGITASRRTVYRRWKGIVQVAREVCGEHLAAC